MSKTKIFGVLAIFLLALVGIAAADDIVVISSVSPVFSMTVAPGGITFPLTVIGENVKLDGNLVTASSNAAYTISARDSSVGAGLEGKLKERVLADGSPTGRAIAAPMQVSINGVYHSLTGVAQPIYTGAPGAYSSPLKLKQVTTATDPVNDASHYYGMTIQITGAASP